MNYAIPLIVSAIFAVSIPGNSVADRNNESSYVMNAPVSVTQADHKRISAAEFKAQEYCRAELKDFDFDAHFSVVSADFYFSGANFYPTQVATLHGNSLKPIQKLKDKCVPGTIVVIDNIKVKGPDGKIRTIDAASYLLY